MGKRAARWCKNAIAMTSTILLKHEQPLSTIYAPVTGVRGFCLNVSQYLFMVALCNRADHIYFHPVVCSFYLFSPRLISAVGDWMSAILPHMVWP